MLYLCHANRLEDLADRLMSDLARPVEDILASEIVVVQGHGIAHWLSLGMAHRQGVVANMRWLFPAEMIWQLFRAVLEDIPATNAFSAEE